jgi:site-specific DNA-methyltransferase (adenine-specific)
MKPYYEEPGITIYCADCRDILPHLPKVDLVLTDPPWNLGYFKDDNKTWDEYAAWLNAIKSTLEVMAETVWIFQSSKSIPYVAHHFKGWNFFANPKSFCQLIRGKVSNAWDIAYFNNSANFCGVSGWRNWHLANNSNNHNSDKTHPTSRPLDTIKYIIGLYSHDTILDPFMGSGTTLVAAKQLGRKAIGIEIEKKYCDIAIDRLRQEVLPLNQHEPEEQTQENLL